MQNERNLTLYRSPEWALVLELYLACQAVVIGLTGSIKSGALGTALRFLEEDYLWTLLFCGFGAALIIATLFELRCRRAGGSECCMRRFAIARELLSLPLVCCWLFAVFLFFWTPLRTVPALGALNIVFSIIIYLENVRAQHKPAQERRSDDAIGLQRVGDVGG